MTLTWTLATGLVTTQLPFLAFVLIFLLFRGNPRTAAGISLFASGTTLAGALLLFVKGGLMTWSLRWMGAGDIAVRFGLLLDPLSLLMLLVVAAVSFLVQVYSLDYMAGDPGFGRYYALLSLFSWAMLSLTASPTLLQLYIFWELVGLSSYLLIGFWYEKFSASEAGKKAFVMTRFGDVAFFLGILLVLIHLGSLDMDVLNSPAAAVALSPGILTLSALLIFGGVVGKSAQFPLLTWLPDAMEGPTPVSALLHSATMVAAGVYLLARLFPFFSRSPAAMTTILAIGTVSLLMASTMALVTRDIKQVWAYSTISQLGFMIMGLGAGGWFAGVFHLTTHAGFKALLFLCSGVFIHAFHTNDIFEIAEKGGRRLRTATIALIVAAAALAGVPPFSGFFSKELILGRLADQPNPVWVWAGLLGAFLTSYYAFRLVFILLRGSRDTKPHGTEASMALPLVILATVTVILGFGEETLRTFLLGEGAPAGAHHAWLPPTAVGLSLAGLGLAWLEFGRRGAPQVGFAERVDVLRSFFLERWYLDRLYRRILDGLVYGVLSAACTRNDRKVIDGAVDGLALSTTTAGKGISRLHTGALQPRLLALFLAVAFLALGGLLL